MSADELTKKEQAQLVRFNEFYRSAPLPAFGDDYDAIRSLFEKGYLDRIVQPSPRPAMYRIKQRLPSEKDIWRAAKILVDQFGEKAPAEALKRAEEFMIKGDDAGERLWRAISENAQKIHTIQPDKPVN